MMANPNSNYCYECALNRVIDRAFKVLDKMEEMRKARKFIEQTSPPPVTTGIWYNPIYPYQYGIDLSVEEAQRRAVNEPPYKKVWEKDTYERNPQQIAFWCAIETIQYFRGLRGFSNWWDGILTERQGEIRNELFERIKGSIPPAPVETIINNPNHIPVVETVWVPRNMMPEGLCCVGAVWYDTTEQVNKYQVEVHDIEKWLKDTALKMANREFVSDSDKNRFKDLAEIIKWRDR
jgi:hypothetical protein